MTAQAAFEALQKANAMTRKKQAERRKNKPDENEPWDEAKRQRQREANKRYQERHKGEPRKRYAVKSDPEKARKHSLDYYYKNREKILEKARGKRNDRSPETAEQREKRLAYLREYNRERYAYMKANNIPRLTDEQRIEYNLKRKERYANDPEYREQVLKASKRSQQKKIQKLIDEIQ